MCSRFSVDFPLEALFALALPGKRLASWNKTSGDAVAGTEQLALVMPITLLVTTMVWGFPFHEKAPGVINSRIEKAFPQGLWHEALEKRRCLIPLSAWWEKKKRGKNLRNYSFRLEPPPFFLGGIYELFARVPHFSLLTKEAFGESRNVHSRMPVYFSRERALEWLAPNLPAERALALALEEGPSPILDGRSWGEPGPEEGQAALFGKSSSQNHKGSTP